MFHHLLIMTEYFVSKALHMDGYYFQFLWVTFMFLLFQRTASQFLMKLWRNTFGVALMVTTNSSRESFWVIFGLILMYVPIFLENCWCFPMKFYTDVLGILWRSLQIISFYVMSMWVPFLCIFLYFLRIIWYLSMEQCFILFEKLK